MMFLAFADTVVENNQDSPRGTIDLHGLYVKEAIERTEKAIAESQRQGMDELRVIVGKGIHSQGHVAKIKPAVQDLMRKWVFFLSLLKLKLEVKHFADTLV